MLLRKLFYLNQLTIDEKEGDEKPGGGDEAKPTLDEAIDKATKDLDKDDEDSKKDDDKEDDKKEDTDDKDEDEDEDEEDDLDEDQKIQAKNVFKLLNNPNTSIETLRALAAQAGLKLEQIETKKEETAAKKTIKDIVKDKIGAKYSFLAEDLGDLLEDLFKTQITESTKDIRTKIAEGELNILKERIVAAQEKVVSEYVDVPVAVLKEFVRMQENGEIVPGPKQPPEKFIRLGIREAAENLKISLVKKSTGSSESTSKKKSSPLDELTSKSRSSSSSMKDGIKSTQVKNINDAIRLAEESIAKEMKKA
jgi:hypothetical protein